ncbi:LPS-assembly protein LptD [Paracoccus sp. (in: a-proteobacteria)]|uniref:LPS-assembly protein LptD n=1 Tax=Paracoccus sp. TaxID=267 RepID=UPI003A8A5341
MTAQMLQRLACASALIGVAAFWPALAPAQVLETGGSATRVEADWMGGAALAPLSDMLSGNMISDRALTLNQPVAATRHRDITISGNAGADGTATRKDAATLLADSVSLQPDNTLIAAGGVVIWYRGARLVASRIVMDGASGDLTIEGPIHMARPGAIDPENDSILIADSAQLDRSLQDGILRGARLMIGRELQIAAREAERSEGGQVMPMRQVVSSACTICQGDGPPLWDVRATSITHDARTRIITLEQPQLRILGLPVAALPFSVSMPDPTVERKSGFLRPTYRTTSQLGFGVIMPYFKTLGDDADLTFLPYVSLDRTRTLGLRYRQAYQSGAMEWNGAITRDDIEKGKTRGYLFGAARFALPRDYQLGLQLQLASDRRYLLDYDITGADRLWSGATLERMRPDRLFLARVGNYHSLRSDESNSRSPAQVADAFRIQRFTPSLIGGEAVLEWSAHAHIRPSDDNRLGRDMARGSVSLDWRRNHILRNGVVASAIAGLSTDLYHIAQDDRYDDLTARVDPLIGVELRWPLMAHGGGATHLIEPAMQILWSPKNSTRDTPNEDSQLVEFDEGNLFSASRFPGNDRREGGLRANLGVSWTRLDPTGWSLRLTGGRVFRSSADDQFPGASPLAGMHSDWLLAGHFDSGTGLAIANRALLGSDMDISRNELRLGWMRPDLQLSAGYLWISSDRDEGRDTDTSEAAAAIGWQIATGWWGNAETRYDFQENQARRASLDVTYRNECVAVTMAVSRRFSDSVSVDPETRFDLSVALGGFGKQKDGPGTVARRRCMR